MIRIIPSICIVSIFFQVNLFSQEITLTELTGFPENLNIKDAKLLDGNLYVTANNSFFHFKEGQGLREIDLSTNLVVDTDYGNATSYNEIFDINDYGQLIIRMTDKEDKYLLTTDTSFSDIKIQEDVTVFDFDLDVSSIFYLAKDTILITVGICSDFGSPVSYYSTDVGETWLALSEFCVPYDSDFIRLGNTIHWYGQTILTNDGFGPELYRVGNHQFDLTTLEFNRTLVYSEYQEPIDPTFKNTNFSYYQDNGKITYTSSYNDFSVYEGAIGNDQITVTGSAPAGVIKAGPQGEGLFVLPRFGNQEGIFYRKELSGDFVELQTNIEDLGKVKDVLQDDLGGFFVIAESKIYYVSGILEYDQGLSGSFFWDENKDCVKNDIETNVKHLYFEFEYDDDQIISHYSTDGSFDLLLPEGSGKIEFYGYDPDLWGKCEAESNFNLDQDEFVSNVDIGVQALRDCESLSLNSGVSQLGACFSSLYVLRIVNDGTLPSGPNTLTLTLPEELELVEISANYTQNNDGSLSIEIPTIDLFEEYILEITLDVSCMADKDEIICIEASVDISDACDEATIVDLVCSPILTSFDPNQITIFNAQGEIDTFYKKEETLYYQIDFQNTGSFMAKDVRLETRISDDLDLRTFKFIGASHDAKIEIKNGRFLEIRFDDIDLPDSTSNLLLSQGFFKYKIQPIPDVEEDTKIYSFADIYFDFNDPVRTNNALAWIDKILSNKNPLLLEDLTIYPNPTDERIGIDGLSPLAKYKYHLFNCNGVLVGSGEISNMDNELDVNQINPGIYFINLTNEKGAKQALRFIKM